MNAFRFRHWLHRHASRLDGTRERRFIALGALALFVALWAGPGILGVVHAAVWSSSRFIASQRTHSPLPTELTNSDASVITNASSSSLASATRFAQLASIALIHPQGNGVAASGVQTEFEAVSAAFRVRSDAAFQQDFPATRGIDGAWRSTFGLPPGRRYELALEIVSSDGLLVRSPTRTIEIPAAASPLMPPAPIQPPTLSILFPSPDAAGSDPIHVAVHIGSASAVAVVFEVRDETDLLTVLPALQAEDGGWTADFSGVPGRYTLAVRATLENGFVQEFSEHRPFHLLPKSSDQASVNTATATPAF